MTEQITARLTDIMCATLPGCSRDAVTPETRLGDLKGWDSIRAATLELELEDAFHVDLGKVALLPDLTIAQLAQAISRMDDRSHG